MTAGAGTVEGHLAGPATVVRRPTRVTSHGRGPSSGSMIVVRLLMLLAGAPLVATGIGLTMVGVFAFIGLPMLVVGLGLVSAAASPRS